MRNSRIKLDGHAFYHVLTQLVDGARPMGPEEREQFRILMRAYETFCGLHVLTYSITASSVHMLVETPESEEQDPDEIVHRMRAIYTPRQIREREALWASWRNDGNEVAVQQDLDRIHSRMNDLSMFMKTLRQRYSQWYNRRTSRRGTLWQERFKSVVLEGRGNVLLTMAAYIDLDAVRKGLVKDPKEYGWSGYGEAMAGGKPARQGLRRLVAVDGGSPSWTTAHKRYRTWLYASDDSRRVGETAGDSSPTQADVERALNGEGNLKLPELLRCQVRYFNDGAVLGSREFVNAVFEKHRGCFGPKRKEGARPLRFGEWNGLCSARDLRKAPLTSPALGND